MAISQKKLEANRRNALLAGRPKGSLGEAMQYAHMFRNYLAERIEKEKGPLITAMLKEATNGNVEAFKALLDRAHGKPAQAVEVTGQNGTPLVFMPLELIQKHSLELSKDIIDGNVTPQIEEEVKP